MIEQEADLLLLQPGSTYLFATRFNEKENWYTLNPHPNASKLITSDATLDIATLESLVAQDPKVLSLQSAYPNEVLLPADIANNRTLNSFHSLPEDKKAEALERAREAKVMLDQKPPHAVVP